MTPIANAVPAQREAHARIQAARARMGRPGPNNVVTYFVDRALAEQREIEAAAAAACSAAEEAAARRTDDREERNAALRVEQARRIERWAVMHAANSMRRARAIVERIAFDAGIRPDDMLGPRRLNARYRQQAMYEVAEANPHWSLPMIGRFFARDHTTVIHALRVVKRRMAEQSPCNASPDNQTHAGAEECR